MRRNNEDRLMGGHKPQNTEDIPQMTNPMDFVTPTEFVELPSKGRYPTGHPLSGQDTIEIRYMTAKDEDLLTNRSLLKKGLAIDRVIDNLIKDNTIKGETLYIGDRNAVLIYARASAYGNIYKTKVSCPSCGATSKQNFDLNEHHIYHGDEYEDFGIEITDRMSFKTTLPLSKIVAEIRPLLGVDERQIVKGNKGKTSMDSLVTNQMKQFTMSFNGHNDKKVINHVVDNMTAMDSKHLRNVFKAISPDLQIRDLFGCDECGHEEEMTVPFGADFFWPNE
tara:strand:- start:1699 stop:2535 length:837 start_codon:yes stop_codon:yes gene_type:complete